MGGAADAQISTPLTIAEQVAGNGIVGLEIMEDCPQMTDIIVSIGGGGLIAGIIAAIKAIKPAVRIWGVEPDAGADDAAIAGGWRARRISRPLRSPRRWARPSSARRRFDLCRAHLKDLILVSDLEIIARAAVLHPA